MHLTHDYCEEVDQQDAPAESCRAAPHQSLITGRWPVADPDTWPLAGSDTGPGPWLAPTPGTWLAPTPDHWLAPTPGPWLAPTSGTGVGAHLSPTQVVDEPSKAWVLRLGWQGSRAVTRVAGKPSGDSL